MDIKVSLNGPIGNFATNQHGAGPTTDRPGPGGSNHGRTERNTLRNRTEPNLLVGAGRTESEQDEVETRNAADQRGAGPTTSGPKPGGLTPSQAEHA